MAKLIVSRSLLRIRQHFVRFFDFFEMFLRRDIVAVSVGVIFHGKAAVCFFQLRVRGCTINPKYLVIIPFCHDLTCYLPSH